jgi:hypothetical protein
MHISMWLVLLLIGIAGCGLLDAPRTAPRNDPDAR